MKIKNLNEKPHDVPAKAHDGVVYTSGVVPVDANGTLVSEDFKK